MNMKLSNKITMIQSMAFLAAALVSFANGAEELTDATEIINQANLASYYSGDDGSAEARMVIVDANGNKQMRQFTILRQDKEDHGDQNMLVFFSRPTDVSGTVFLVGKKVTTDDDRWLYLPGLDLVKRISAGDKRTSFVGSHFYYEDVSGRNPNEDTYTLLTEQSKGASYFVKGQPKEPSSVEFSYLIAQIDKKTMMPMQVTYFDGNGDKLREMKVLKTQNIAGFNTVMHSRITQFSDNSFTEMQFRNVKYNLGLPDNIFSERSLRNPPKTWLN